MFGRAQCAPRITLGDVTAMTGPFAQAGLRARRPLFAAAMAGMLALPLLATPAAARGPDGITEVAEAVIDAVVNISTSQKVEARQQGGGGGASPQLPPGSPFEEFFEEFFKNRRQ